MNDSPRRFDSCAKCGTPARMTTLGILLDDEQPVWDRDSRREVPRKRTWRKCPCGEVELWAAVAGRWIPATPREQLLAEEALKKGQTLPWPWNEARFA